MHFLKNLIFFSLLITACAPQNGGSPIAPEVAPEDKAALNAKAVLFVFRDGICTTLEKGMTVSELPNLSLSESDVLALVAYEADNNIFMSNIDSGKNAIEYYIGKNVPSLGFPKMWAGSAVVNQKSGAAAPVLKPITASVTLQIKSRPQGLSSASIKLPLTNDSYYPADGSYSINDYPRNAVLSTDNTETIYTFPSIEDAPWDPIVTFRLGEETLEARIPAGIRLNAGMDIIITADFSDYAESGTCRLSCSDGINNYTETVFVFSTCDSPSRQYQVLVWQNGLWREKTTREALCSDAARHRAIWNDWDNSLALRDTMSYCIFEDDFTGPVQVLVRNLRGSAANACIRPSIWSIIPQSVGDDAIRFSLPVYEKRKVSVEFENDRQHNLFLFPSRPDNQIPSGNKVRYYGPGEHNVTRVDLYDGETLYIDYGAILYAEINVHGNDCTIAGHGVLCGSKLLHWGDQWSNGKIILNCNPSRGKTLKNLTIKDITIIDSPSWNISICNYDGAVVDGVNMISWELNGDGVDVVCSTNVEVKNCFLRNYDDCITLKVRFTANPVSDLCNVHVHDNLIWNDYARGIAVGPEAGNINYGTGYIHDILIDDCIILQHKGGSSMEDLRAGFAIGQNASPDHDWGGGTAERMERITARNLVFDNIASSGRNVAIWQYTDMDATCVMNDVTLENFTIYDGNNTTAPAFFARTWQHSINGLHIRNFVLNGEKITSTGPEFVVSGNVTIDFE